jgi:hypothetical protein
MSDVGRPHEYDCPVRLYGSYECSCPGGRDLTPEILDKHEQLALWSAFVERVKLTFPFRIDVTLGWDGDRLQMGTELHVLERDTREPITVHTRRHCGAWTDDEAAIELLFDLLGIALTHETHESVRLDGKLVRELHVPR